MSILCKMQLVCDGDLECTTTAKQRIKLLKDHTKPVHVALYRAAPKTKEFEKAELDKMLLQQVIEPAQTRRAAPIVLASKKNGTLQFCVDQRKLNVFTKRDSYLMAWMDVCINTLGEDVIFFTLHGNSWY